MTVNPLHLLSIPFYAAVLAACSVFLLGYAVFKCIRTWSGKSLSQNWRRATFLAEILVAVGLIGLLTFAGRTKIDSDTADQQAYVYETELGLSKVLLEPIRRYCALQTLALPTQAPLATLSAACKAWIDGQRAIFTDRNFDWDNVIQKSEGLAYDLHARPEQKEAANTVIVEAKHHVSAVNAQRRSAMDAQILRSYGNTAWPFLLICGICAILGVSIKCARACNELLGGPTSDQKNT